MSKGDITENDLMKFYFNNIAMPSYGSNLWLSLHSADPGEAGDQSTNEIVYTGYNRISIARDGTGFTVTGNTAVNVSLAQFGQSSTGPVTATHFAIGTLGSGAGQILYSSALTAPLVINNLVQPQLAAGSLTIQED